MLSEKFFEGCDNFGSEEETPKGLNIELSFYFVVLDDTELNEVMICRNYIGKYITFHLQSFLEKGIKGDVVEGGIYLRIVLSKSQYKSVEERLLLERDAKKYNL